jgi:hypothetical protein
MPSVTGESLIPEKATLGQREIADWFVGFLTMCKISMNEVGRRRRVVRPRLGR